MKQLPSQPNQGLIDGMEVLQLLVTNGKEMSGLEIAQTLNIEKTKVNRILKTLAYMGFAISTSNRKYTTGPGIHVLSAQTLHGSGLIKSAIKHLVELTQYNMVVAMGSLWRDKVAYTYHWEPGLLPSEGLGRIDLFPATQSSIGMILLSELSNEEIESYIDFKKDIPGFDSPHAFMIAIEQTREKQFGINHYFENSSMAVSIGKPGYAALALAQTNPNQKLEDYLDILKDKADIIEKEGPVYNRIQLYQDIIPNHTVKAI